MNVNYNTEVNDMLEKKIQFHFISKNPFNDTILKFLTDKKRLNLDQRQFSKMMRDLNNRETFLIILENIVEMGFLDYIGERYITFDEKGANHLLKYKINDGHLYIYDLLSSLENQKLLEVSTINGFDVKKILDSFSELGYNDEQIQILIQHKEILTNMGFESEKYQILLPSEERILDLSNPNLKIDKNIFYKEHKKSSLLDKENFTSLILEEKNEEKVSYSFDGNIKLLKILHGISKSSSDLSLFEDIIKKNYDSIGYKDCGDTSVDWMYISSFFLMNKIENNDLPDYIYDDFDRRLKSINCGKKIIFLDDNNVELSYGYNVDDISFGSNSFLFKDGTFDTKQLFQVIRDGLAHSFEVVDDDYVRIYYYDESSNSLSTNFKIKKDIILDFIDKISEYRSFGNIFPICALENPNVSNKNIADLTELNTYLRDIVVSDVVIKSYKGLDKKKELYEELSKNNELRNRNLRNYLEYNYTNKISSMKRDLSCPIITPIELIRDYSKSGLNRFVDYEYKEIKLTDDQITKIIPKIELIKDTFFGQSAYNQHDIITELVRNELNPNRNITSIISDLVKVKDKANGSIMDMLNETSSKYINYDKVVKATLIAYLNNLFLYNYEKRAELNDLDFSNLKIDYDFKELINDRKKRKSDLLNERKKIYAPISKINSRIKDISKYLDKLYDENNEELIIKIRYELLTLENKKNEELEIIDNDIDKSNEINSINKEIVLLDEEIEQLSVGTMKPSYILKHFRNSLAHGNISFNDTLDINNISNLEITFTDYYPKSTKESFKGKIKLKDLLETLNKEDTIEKIFGQNNEHTLKQ